MRSISTSRSNVSFSGSTRSSSERSGLISVNVLSSRSMIACPSGTLISLSVIGCRRWPGADLRDGVAAGGVAGGAPAVGRELADGAVELDRPAERVQVVREPPGARLLDRPPFALGGDRRRRLAFLGDLEPAAGQRVEQRRLAVGACALAQAGGVAGDQPVAVELDEAVVDAAGRAAG